MMNASNNKKMNFEDVNPLTGGIDVTGTVEFDNKNNKTIFTFNIPGMDPIVVPKDGHYNNNQIYEFMGAFKEKAEELFKKQKK